MLAGRERTVPALGVWLANTNPILGLFRALRVQPRNIQMLSMYPQTRAKNVPLIQSLQLAASQTPYVNVTLGTRGKMEAHARCALSTNTKKNWGLLLALIVHQTLPLQLAALQTPSVNVTLGTRETMEAHALSVL